jgi:PIN domain nuclease of toxin-antitoxin system
MTTDGLLLDTCFVLWLSAQQPVARSAVEEVTKVRKAGGVIAISAMSAWEIGLLVAKGRLPYIKSPLTWFERFVDEGQVEVARADVEVLIDSSFLPGNAHSDATDRIIIATARARNLAIVTRDRAMLAYGAAGYVKTVRC